MRSTTAEVSWTVPAPPEKVWDALTHPEDRSFFLGAEVVSDFRVGSAIRFKGEYQGKRFEDHGKILEAESNRRLSFTHFSPMSGAADTPENYHVVTFDLAPEGDGTRVTLTQANLNGEIKPSDVEHRGEYEKTWAGVLESLSNAAAH